MREQYVLKRKIKHLKNNETNYIKYLLFSPHQKLIDCCLKIQNFIETYIYTIRYFTIGPLNFLKTAKNETNFYQTKEILRIRNLVSTLEACKNVIRYEVFAKILIRQETESFGRSGGWTVASFLQRQVTP